MAVELLDALQSSGVLLGRAIQTRESRRLTERDFQRAMESVTGGHPHPLELAHWPGVGPVDLTLPGGTALELKWCNSGDTLLNCVWDIAKLGCAIAEREIAQGLIVAGAPAAHWADGAPGVELFAPAVYDREALVSRYESWWRFWCKDVLTRPSDLPSAIAVAEAGSVSVSLGGVPFVLRAATVSVADEVWQTHVCPHRWGGERCAPRPWDPDGWGGLPE